ncbi:MAG: RluA family pseudouridine synthase [Hydrogenobaculum sp.]|nr:MAG: RluA family pseudouridine synthase [Hydrogenobaculum sp.]
MPQIKITPDIANERIDLLISKIYPDISREYIKKVIRENGVSINGEKVFKSSKKVFENDILEFEIPPPKKLDVKAQDIPIEILYEDKDLAVVVKPSGMPSHTGPGHDENTLVNALLSKFGNLSVIGGVERPGIVHRLDRYTHGIMVIAKNDISHQMLSSMFKNREIDKRYKAIVYGIPRFKEQTIETLIRRHPTNRLKFEVAPEGKESITKYYLEKPLKNASLLDIKIYTGRTHQIRVHMSYIGHPIIGDTLYGYKHSYFDKTLQEIIGERFLLVAYKLSFLHPKSQKPMNFEIDMPDYFKNVLKYLES